MAGAVATLLLSPDSGENTRAKIRKGAGDLFSGIIEEESPSDSWKTLLLMIVRNLRSNLDA